MFKPTRPARVLQWFLALAFFTTAGLASSQATVSGPLALAKNPAPTADLLKQLRDTFPSSRIDSVAPTVMAGVFEVVSGPNLFYTDAGGRYFLFGKLFDMQTRTDITAARLTEVQRLDVSALPHSYAVKHVRGKGSRTLYVFADPNCGHCKAFEKTLQAVEDVTIYTYIVPLLGPDSREKARAIWCSPDRARAWTEWMVRSIAPPPARDGCDDPIDLNFELAQKLEMPGTPMSLSSDGRRLMGAVSAAEINALLSPAANSAVSASATSR